MFVRTGGPPHNWQEYRILDLNTNKLIPNVKEADDGSGAYTIVIKNPATGVPLVNQHGQERIKKQFGNIRIVHVSQLQPNNIAPHFTKDPNR